MAKVLLKIGNERFVLPNDRGAMTVLNTLSKAVWVREDYSSRIDYRSAKVYVEEPGEFDLKLDMLTPRDVIRRKRKSAELPENAGPDSEGRDITKRDR